MPVIKYKTIEEVGNLLSASRLWPTVVVMTVKGSLKHRIELLGEEIEEAALTDEQLVLRNVASAQGFDDLTSDHLARPAWGKGAFFYCEPAHALLLSLIHI